MKVEELKSTLKEKGFKEEEQDTGMKYSFESGKVELICYIEPEVEVEFISLYRWDNNEVKGTHNLSINELAQTKDSVKTLLRKTKNNIPEYIGEKINVHAELDDVINKLF